MKVILEKYDWVIFDADETLFHFRSRAGLDKMFETLNIAFTDEDYLEYKSLNNQLWKQYETHEVSAQQLAERRFSKWTTSERSGADLNRSFLHAMADVCDLLDGVSDLIAFLKTAGKKLGIISNGFTQLQEVRLKQNNLLSSFDFIVTSEEAGIAKPHHEIFDLAFKKMGNPDKSTVLMVGDNPNSDIKGAQRYNIDSCWLNCFLKPTPDQVKPTFEVRSMAHLQDLLTPGHSL